jgi:hypothetical protein
VDVRFRIPLVGVDAVQDAAEIAAARAEHPIEPITKLRRLDLAAIRRADGGQQGAVRDRCLHEVEGAKMLELVRVQVSPAEPGDEQGAWSEHALIREVVDREHGR